MALGVIRLAFQLFETVGGFLRGDHALFDLPGDVAALDRQFGEVHGGIARPGVVQGLDGGAEGGAVFLVLELAFLAQPDQQHAFALGFRHAVQQQRRAELAVQVAAPQDFAQIAAGLAVQGFRRRGELARFEDADHHAAAALFFRATAFYAKFHTLLLEFLPVAVTEICPDARLFAKKRHKVKTRYAYERFSNALTPTPLQAPARSVPAGCPPLCGDHGETGEGLNSLLPQAGEGTGMRECGIRCSPLN